MGLCNAPTFRCTFSHIFDHDEETFDRICKDKRAQEYGYAKLEIDGLPPLHVDEDSIKHPNEDHAVHFHYERDDASVKVNPSSRRRVALPKFPLSETAEKNWTRMKLKAFVEDTLKNPPEEAVYIIGEQTFPYAKLSSGQKLERRGSGNLPGINTPYQYFSASGGRTITIFHYEDAWLGSKNVVLEGENKVLVVISPRSNKLFEARMYEKFPGPRRDSQGIRHLGRAVPPSLLDKWGVQYDTACLTPGQGFATLPGSIYHMVINMGDNLALATNWEQLSSPDMPEGYEWCDRNCDSRAITARHFQLPRRTPLTVPPGANLTRKRNWEGSPGSGKKPRIVAQRLEVQARIDKPQALKEFILSTKALAQHISRVRAFRSWGTPMKAKLRASRTASAREIDGLIQASEGGELLQRFLKRLMQVQQEREVKARMRTQNLKRASPKIIEDMLRWRQWPNTEEYRAKLRKEREQSAKLEKICSGKYRGLLCFFPHEDSPLDMREPDIERLLSLIRRDDKVATLCNFGSDFVNWILDDNEIPEYVLERKSLVDLEQLSLADQLALLRET